jgi:hypothetical protein
MFIALCILIVTILTLSKTIRASEYSSWSPRRAARKGSFAESGSRSKIAAKVSSQSSSGNVRRVVAATGPSISGNTVISDDMTIHNGMKVLVRRTQECKQWFDVT